MMNYAGKDAKFQIVERIPEKQLSGGEKCRVWWYFWCGGFWHRKEHMRKDGIVKEKRLGVGNG